MPDVGPSMKVIAAAPVMRVMIFLAVKFVNLLV